MTISAEAVKSPEFESALEQGIEALRRLADFQIDPVIRSKMQKLGERKEFLSKEEHDELLSFVAFAESRNLEKLEATVALKKLEHFVPDIAN